MCVADIRLLDLAAILCLTYNVHTGRHITIHMAHHLQLYPHFAVLTERARSMF